MEMIMFYATLLVISLFTIGIIFARLYRRASKEISFVRTGMGGQKVIMNGGALVFPILHEIIPVNMNTLRLAVARSNDQALITRDRMRVDVVTDFYVRVQPTSEAIAAAAQTLGQRTMQPQLLRELVEGKFVDALRSVASEMTMEELHEKRIDFVQKVQQVVTEDILKNGLELEAVSLTNLDQTGIDFFNPNNAFDAEGLTRLTDEIERRRKIRNDIEQETQVQIRTKNLEAEQQKLKISREEEYARLAQQREIETRRAAQSAEIAKQRAEQEQDAEQAQINAALQVEQARIESERAIASQRIENERTIREQEIIKQRLVEAQQVDKRKVIELAEQERAIAIAEKSKEQSEMQAQADQAKAMAVQAEEQVKTVREKEIAERLKHIELIQAAKEAERDAIVIKVAAAAEKEAANDKAVAVRTLATADADKARISAEGLAEAEKLQADAAQIRYAVDAEGTRALNEASNLLSPEQIAMQIKIKLIENLDRIIRESVKPMENIDSIKVVQVDGLNCVAGGVAGSDGHSHAKNLPDQVVNSALRYRAQAPLLDSLLKEVGLSADDINGLTKPLMETEES